MEVVLFRHAQKGITPFEDPELTAEGLRQAEMIATLVAKKIIPPPTHAWASPKIRTSQTLQPACESRQIKIQKTDFLNLRSDRETSLVFNRRIAEFLLQFEKNKTAHSSETHFLCTHYDWIEEAMTLINCDKDLNSFEYSHWAPTQFIVFEITQAHWKLVRKGSAHAAIID